MKTQTLLAAGLAAFVGLVALSACSSDSISAGADGEGGSSGSLVSPDSGTVTPDAKTSAGRCPSSVCPEGRTTCPNDPFPCSVDLTSDDDNCGACGLRCPTDDAFVGRFNGAMRCVASTCQLICKGAFADCNNLPEDGCEVQIAGPGADDKNNCGACGNVCDDFCKNGACGCPAGGTLCPDGECHDLNREDENCGRCGNLCPASDPDEFPPEWNMWRTCRAGECNKISCQYGSADCNSDAHLPTGDGCETGTTGDPENCGSCGNKCSPGEQCIFGKCLCPCGASCFTAINTDPYNCGSCSLKCPGDWRTVEGNASLALDPSHGRPTCEQGVCGYSCSPRHADCDGNVDNGCETPLNDDPLNCGACGVRCDGIAGQACVEGRCLMKDCEVIQ